MKLSEILGQIDQQKLITMIFDKVMSHDNRNEKKDFFDLVSETIDQIYGVENETVQKAQKRFIVAEATCP